jgi:hypothetical protein
VAKSRKVAPSRRPGKGKLQRWQAILAAIIAAIASVIAALITTLGGSSGQVPNNGANIVGNVSMTSFYQTPSATPTGRVLFLPWHCFELVGGELVRWRNLCDNSTPWYSCVISAIMVGVPACTSNPCPSMGCELETFESTCQCPMGCCFDDRDLSTQRVDIPRGELSTVAHRVAHRATNCAICIRLGPVWTGCSGGVSDKRTHSKSVAVKAVLLSDLGPCHSSDRRRLNPRQDSWSRVARSAIEDASAASALDHDLARLQDEAPEGWHLLRLARQR